MFQYVGGVVNNENASILYSSVLCLMIVSRVRAGECSWRQALGLGLLVGGGLWIKQTTLYEAPVAIWALWTAGAPARRWARLGLFAAGAAIVGVGWPLHNYLTSGDPFPLFVPAPHQEQIPGQIGAHPLTLLAWLRLVLETSFLPDWSWGLMPRELSTVAAFGAAGAVLAAFAFSLRAGGDAKTRRLRAMALAALVTLLVGILEYCVFKDWRAQIGGRYLLNGLPWFLTLLATSLLLIRERTAPKPLPGGAALLLGVGAVLVALFDVAWWYVVFLYYSNPAFGHSHV